MLCIKKNLNYGKIHFGVCVGHHISSDLGVNLFNIVLKLKVFKNV